MQDECKDDLLNRLLFIKSVISPIIIEEETTERMKWGKFYRLFLQMNPKKSMIYRETVEPERLQNETSSFWFQSSCKIVQNYSKICEKNLKLPIVINVHPTELQWGKKQLKSSKIPWPSVLQSDLLRCIGSSLDEFIGIVLWFLTSQVSYAPTCSFMLIYYKFTKARRLEQNQLCTTWSADL